MTQYKDIYFTEGYQKLFQETEFGGQPGRYVNSGVEYRFYLRPIQNTPYCDIVSPYGYSGPTAIEDKPDYEMFEHNFSEYCDKNKIIAEFRRCHPWESVFDTVKANYEHNVFFIDLTQTEKEISNGFDKGCKSTIKKGAKSLYITQSYGLSYPLLNLYNETMRRNGASQSYIFDYPFLDKLSTLYPHCSTFSVRDSTHIIGAAVFLTYGDYCHYFLSGSEINNLGATNLILFSAIKWAKDEGFKVFDLGGGISRGDTLESFKKSFTHQVKPYYTIRKIHNELVYYELCKVNGIKPDQEGYFPTYRRDNKGEK
jgi:hypothetical protein